MDTKTQNCPYQQNVIGGNSMLDSIINKYLNEKSAFCIVDMSDYTVLTKDKKFKNIDSITTSETNNIEQFNSENDAKTHMTKIKQRGQTLAVTQMKDVHKIFYMRQVNKKN